MITGTTDIGLLWSLKRKNKEAAGIRQLTSCDTNLDGVHYTSEQLWIRENYHSQIQLTNLILKSPCTGMLKQNCQFEVITLISVYHLDKNMFGEGLSSFKNELLV